MQRHTLPALPSGSNATLGIKKSYSRYFLVPVLFGLWFDSSLTGICYVIILQSNPRDVPRAQLDWTFRILLLRFIAKQRKTVEEKAETSPLRDNFNQKISLAGKTSEARLRSEAFLLVVKSARWTAEPASGNEAQQF